MIAKNNQGAQMEEKHITTFKQSIVHEVSRTAMFLRANGSQMFDACNFDLTVEQYAVLDAVCNSEHLCQRDLSKVLMKDRSNISRILSILEEKGLLVRKTEMKGKSPVKKVYITQAGTDCVNKIFPILKEKYLEQIAPMKEEEIEMLKVLLKKLRECLKQNTVIQI